MEKDFNKFDYNYAKEITIEYLNKKLYRYSC